MGSISILNLCRSSHLQLRCVPFQVILPVVQPALNRMVKPSVRRILTVIIPIISDAYRDTLSIFHDTSSQAIETISSTGMESAAETLAVLSRSVTSTVRCREHPLNSIVAKVERLKTHFDDGVTESLEQDGIVVHPDTIVDTVLAALQTMMDQAVYAFDDEINEYRNSTTDLQPAAPDLRKLHQRLVNALHYDSHASMATLISTVTKGMVLPPYLEHVHAPAHEAAVRNISLYQNCLSGDQVGSGGMSSSGDAASVIHQALDVKKMTQAKIVSLAAEPIQVVAVGNCSSLLIGSRGGGECPTCQAKVQASGEEERSPEEPFLNAQHHHGAAQHPSFATRVEDELHPHAQMEDNGDESDDSYAAWGWDSENPQPAGRTSVGASAVVGIGRTDGILMQERFPGQQGAARTGALTSGPAVGSSTLPGSGIVGGAPRRPRSSAHHSGIATGGGVAVGAGAGPSIQAMSAQWRQGLSLQRPAREPGRKTAVSAGRGSPSGARRGLGQGSVGSGPAVRGAARAASPTRSRTSDGDRSSRSDES